MGADVFYYDAVVEGFIRLQPLSWDYDTLCSLSERNKRRWTCGC